MLDVNESTVTALDGDGRNAALYRRSEEADRPSVLRLASVYLRYRWTVIGATLAGAILFVTVGLLRSSSYTAMVSFAPQSESGFDSPNVARLAGQFGINVGSRSQSLSPDFYVQLVESRAILSKLAADSFAMRAGAMPAGGGKRPLPQVLEVRGESASERHASSVLWLARAVSASAAPESGIVTIAVKSLDPVLSAGIAGRILELVHVFNQQTRQSQAAAEAGFVEQRAEDALSQLRAAESELQRFLERNRQFRSSPQLTFERERLQREVAMRQEVYTSLIQSLEEARIDQVRNTPLVTVIDQAEAPFRRDPRRLSLFAVIGLTVGFVFGSILAFGRDLARRELQLETGEYGEFSALLADLRRDLRRLLRRPTPANGN
jgi:uncharacterized protein involved in exopolysaccharide biosynthesis